MPARLVYTVAGTAATLPGRARRGETLVGAENRPLSGRWLAAGAAVVAVALFALLHALVRRDRSSAADLRATLAVQRVRHPVFQRLMTAVSWPGFPPRSWIIPALLPVGWIAAGRPREAAFQLAGWGTGILSTLAKRRAQRPRPNHPSIAVAVAHLGGTSFPSGHVLIYTGVYGTLFYLLGRSGGGTGPARLARALLALLLTLVGPSRIYLGHHWLSDVTASYLLGGAYVWLLTRLYERGWGRQLERA